MTKKHFIALANTIKESNYMESPAPFTPETIEILANFLNKTFPSFKRDVWLAYIERR